MFVIVSTYRAKPGEEDAIIALHEQWERVNSVGGFLSGELLRGIDDDRVFVDIARFASAEVARAVAGDPAYEAFTQRLESLMESPATYMACGAPWQAGDKRAAG